MKRENPRRSTASSIVVDGKNACLRTGSTEVDHVLRGYRCAFEVEHDLRDGREGSESEKQHSGDEPRRVAGGIGRLPRQKVGSGGGIERYRALNVCEVVVVNPNRVRLIAESRKKTDSVDARLLAELLRLGAAPEVHVPSAEARRKRTQLSVRRQLVRQRTGVVNQARGLLRGWGVSLEARGLGTLQGWKKVLRRKELPPYVKELVAVLGGVFEQLSEALEGMKLRLNEEAAGDERVKRLQTIPGVGKISALTLVAAVDQVERFQTSKQMTGYFGIVPTVRASGER